MAISLFFQYFIPFNLFSKMFVQNYAGHLFIIGSRIFIFVALVQSLQSSQPICVSVKIIWNRNLNKWTLFCMMMNWNKWESYLSDPIQPLLWCIETVFSMIECHLWCDDKLQKKKNTFHFILDLNSLDELFVIVS